MNRDQAVKTIGRSANDTDLSALVMELLSRAMASKGDFDAQDEVARHRSEQAEVHAQKAYDAYYAMRIDEAMEEADAAIRYMEGDL